MSTIEGSRRTRNRTTMKKVTMSRKTILNGRKKTWEGAE